MRANFGFAERTRINHRPGHILLAEDSLEIAKLFSLALTQAGHQVSVAYDGKLAMELLTKQCVNLAILDVNLPEADGFEVCRFLKGQDDLRHVPVIFCTGRQHPDDQIRARKLGASAFLNKPLTMTELITAVDLVLQESRTVGLRSSSSP
jgi:DNA-binding response OmpR family regulator